MGSMLVSVNTLINEYDLDLLNFENLFDCQYFISP